jgi:hypothetical protein
VREKKKGLKKIKERRSVKKKRILKKGISETIQRKLSCLMSTALVRWVATAAV